MSELYCGKMRVELLALKSTINLLKFVITSIQLKHESDYHSNDGWLNCKTLVSEKYVL